MGVNGSPDEQFSARLPFIRDTSGHGVLVEINFQRGDPARGGKQREGEDRDRRRGMGNFRNEVRGD